MCLPLKRIRNPDILVPLALFFGVLSAWCLTWYLLVDDTGRGTFGDMFGAVNALFSGLAFAGVIYAILLQRKELSLQRKELELTRSELAGQKEQMQAQNQTLIKQNFENTFFQLVRVLNELTSSIDLRSGDKITSGKDCFNSFYKRLHTQWIKSTKEDSNDELSMINKAYINFYRLNQHEIGHYFRTLYNIIKFVDSSDVKNKRFYTNIVRAQLSSQELCLLFYNCLSDKGREKFKPLVEKYSLLKSVPKNDLFVPDRHIGLYDTKAF